MVVYGFDKTTTSRQEAKMDENAVRKIVVETGVQIRREFRLGLLETVCGAILAKVLVARGLQVEPQFPAQNADSSLFPNFLATLLRPRAIRSASSRVASGVKMIRPSAIWF